MTLSGENCVHVVMNDYSHGLMEFVVVLVDSIHKFQRVTQCWNRDMELNKTMMKVVTCIEIQAMMWGRTFWNCEIKMFEIQTGNLHSPLNRALMLAQCQVTSSIIISSGCLGNSSLAPIFTPEIISVLYKSNLSWLRTWHSGPGKPSKPNHFLQAPMC